MRGKSLTTLRKEEAEIARRLEQIRDTIDRLGAVQAGRPARRATVRRTRRLSSAGREAISRAAKKRWAAYRRQKRRAQS